MIKKIIKNENIENLKLAKTVVLNGKIGYCDTYDENESSIGVKEVKRIKKLDGTYINQELNGTPLCPSFERELGWGRRYANVQMLIGDTPIDMEHIDETKIVSMIGETQHEYYHQYSECTGYLWTVEKFKIGGHDLLQILRSNEGKYIHLEIELYDKRR